MVMIHTHAKVKSLGLKDRVETIGPIEMEPIASPSLLLWFVDLTMNHKASKVKIYLFIRDNVVNTQLYECDIPCCSVVQLVA